MNRTTLRGAATLLAIAPVLAGCETLPDMGHPLTGTTWQLTDIDTSGSSTRLTPALQERHTITFEDGGRVFMQLDCNRGNASWSADQPRGGTGGLTIGPVASTRALCPQPSFGDKMAADLQEAQRYTLVLEGRRLIIETGDLAYTFNAF